MIINISSFEQSEFKISYLMFFRSYVNFLCNSQMDNHSQNLIFTFGRKEYVRLRKDTIWKESPVLTSCCHACIQFYFDVCGILHLQQDVCPESGVPAH